MLGYRPVRLGAVLIAAAAALVLPGSVSAATLTFSAEGRVTFTAGLDRDNVIYLQEPERGRLYLVHGRDPIYHAMPEGCSYLSSEEVYCQGVTAVSVDTLDGDDFVLPLGASGCSSSSVKSGL